MTIGRLPAVEGGIQPTIIDAKGDLIAGVTNDTPGRLPVGADGAVLQADSTASTGVSWAGPLFAAGKNKIINGDFYVNQRGFTSNTTSDSYNFDRWVQLNGGSSGTLTITPQTFTLGTAPVSGYEGKNFIQCVTASGASADTYSILAQKIESVRTLAGQTATISFWAKASSGTPKIGVEVEQFFGTGGSPSSAVDASAGAVTLSTSWARYSVTVSVPSISGKTIGTNNNDQLGVFLWLSAGSTFASRASSIGLQNATFQIWGVQVEAGSVATPFTTATGTIQGELAACQRYYIRINPSTTQGSFGTGFAPATTYALTDVFLPVTQRVAADTFEFSNVRWFDGATTYTPSNVAINMSGNSQVEIALFISGLTQYRPGIARFLNSSSYIGISAEL